MKGGYTFYIGYMPNRYWKHLKGTWKYNFNNKKGKKHFFVILSCQRNHSELHYQSKVCITYAMCISTLIMSSPCNKERIKHITQ